MPVASRLECNSRGNPPSNNLVDLAKVGRAALDRPQTSDNKDRLAGL